MWSPSIFRHCTAFFFIKLWRSRSLSRLKNNGPNAHWDYTLPRKSDAYHTRYPVAYPGILTHSKYTPERERDRLVFWLKTVLRIYEKRCYDYAKCLGYVTRCRRAVLTKWFAFIPPKHDCSRNRRKDNPDTTSVRNPTKRIWGKKTL